MTKLRKFFASSVMVMTVVVMSGLTAPMTTNAAASAGDLIKKDGLSAVYYLGEDGKRYVFPNEATYKSWYSDFSGVVTVSADELASYPLGANVVVRPGTKLVKITTDPKVYAVEANGTLRWVQTEADAIALYGANWASRVIDVADSFFTNYTIGTPLASDEVPAGSLVQKTGEGNIYYYDGTDYRLIEDEVAFLANRFQFANVLTIDNFTASGSTITGAEAAIIKTSQGGAATGWQPGQGTGVTVSLNSMTPASQSVPMTASRIPFTKVNLTASNDGIAYVNSITIRRTGLTTIDGNFQVWAEKNGISVSSKRTLNNDEATLTFSPTLTIPAGQTITLDVLANVNDVSGNGALGIASASAVSASGSTISGSFPIVGNLMSFTTYTIATVSFDGNNETLTAQVGEDNVNLGGFELNLQDNKDVVFQSISLRNSGVETLGDVLMNVYLENNGERVSDYATFNGRYATFNLLNGGMTIERDDQVQNFTIKADVIGKDSSTAGSIVLALHKLEDVSIYEKATGFGVTITQTNLTVSSVNIDAGSVTVSKKAGSPTGTKTVVKGDKDVLVLLANIKADEAIEAEGMNINVDSYDDDSFYNAKVFLNNSLIATFYSDDVSSSSEYLVDSSLLLNKGDNEVKVTVDVRTTATSTNQFKVSLADSNLLEYPEYVSNGLAVDDITGDAVGATLEVKGADLEVARVDGSSDKTVVQGSEGETLGLFSYKANNSSATISSITVSKNMYGGGATSTLDTHIKNLELYINGSKVAGPKNLTSSGITFSSLNKYIAEGSVVTFELKGNLDSSAAINNESYFMLNLTTVAKDSVNKNIEDISVVSTRIFKVLTEGSLDVEVLSSPSSRYLSSNPNTSYEVARFEFEATYDVAKIEELSFVKATTTVAADSIIRTVDLYSGETKIASGVLFNNSVEFKNLSGKFDINPGSSNAKVLSLRISLNNIEEGSESPQGFYFELDSYKFRTSWGEVIEELSVGSQGNAFLVVKSVPVVARQTLSSFNLSFGQNSAKQIARFSVTADANGKINIEKIVLNVSLSNVSTSTIDSITLKDGSTVISGSNNYDDDTSTIILNPSENISISAGMTKTFDVFATFTTTDTNSSFSTTLEDTGFYWNDNIGSSFDGEYVEGLDLPISWDLSRS